MSQPSQTLPVHSLIEAGLYLRVRPCAACGDGPLVADDVGINHDADRHILAVPTVCRACNQQAEFAFDTAGIELHESPVVFLSNIAPGAPINHTDEPSRIIDVADWLTLYSIIETEARTVADRMESRQLHISAARCIDEALKFFDADNDLPPGDALFTDRSRDQFHRCPERFTRQNLIDLRNKLPVKRWPRIDLTSDEQSPSPAKRWWRPW
ncbi:MAG: hypothetical protein JSV03_03920 [Planctomycetota bacterium]|nr:MAG: hypothetical protein JSV03_03920 [Planctomycetota bacterium]